MPLDRPSNPGRFLFFSLLSMFFSIFARFRLDVLLALFLLRVLLVRTVFVRSFHFLFFCFFFSSLLTDLCNSFGSSKTFSPLALQRSFPGVLLMPLAFLFGRRQRRLNPFSLKRFREQISLRFFFFLPLDLNDGTSSTSTLPNAKFIFG